MKIGWRFPPLSGGTKQGYTNNDIEGFKGEELIDNLAREICQNSLDARDKNSLEPVKVVFELKHVERDKYDVFSGYEKCLQGCRRFWSRGEKIDEKLETFLDDAESVLSKPQISVLIASDYNTRGLVGNHNLDALDTPWEALTGADGMSVKPDDNSGGSFGIGKNAPFACSALSMVFYNTLDEDDKRAFIGVARAATLFNEQGKATQRVGRYQNNDDDNEIWKPIYKEDANNFRDLFYRKEKGTDIIIVGFNETESWEHNVAKAVIKNFFVAIHENKLVVEIKGDGDSFIIDATKIADKIDEYAKTDKQVAITAQLYAAFTQPDNKVSLTVLEEEAAAEIYIKAESSYSRTIANFRSTGMLVGKGYNKIFQHYAAILIVRGEKLGKLLRACEPPRHNRWDHKLIKGESKGQKDKRNDARKALSFLDGELVKLLKAQYEVPAGNSIDAVGVSAHLADTEDGSLPTDATGTDILRVKVKIGKPKIKKNKPEEMVVRGKPQEGAETSGDYGNETQSPDPKPGVKKPRVNPPKEDTETKKGIGEGKGSKIIPIKDLPQRRAFPVSAALGMYKIVIKPKKDYEALYVECVAAGEDGRTDDLKISKFMYQGKPVNCVGGKAGPIKIPADIPAEFMVTFENKEKMGLSLILSEGGR